MGKTPHQTHSPQSTWKVSSAEAIYSILKRMHRAARIPDDDAEALQIGARNSTWVLYGFVVQVERIPMWRISLFTPPEGDAFWHCKKKRVVFCQAFISVSFANMWVDQYITFIWTIIMKPFDLLQPGHYGLRLSSVAAAFPALLHSI